MQLATANAAANIDVAADGAAFDGAHVVRALHVAADALDSHRPAQVLDVHVAGDALDPGGTSCPVHVKITADRLGVDRGFTRDGDFEVHTEALTAEQIPPAALLLVEMRLDEYVVAPLLDADLDVLEKTLRAIGAPALDALPCDDPHLAGLSHADGGLAGHVLDLKTRHSLDHEGLFDRLVVRLAAAVVHSDERRAHRARDLTGIDVDPVDAEFHPT